MNTLSNTISPLTLSHTSSMSDVIYKNYNDKSNPVFEIGHNNYVPNIFVQYARGQIF